MRFSLALAVAAIAIHGRSEAADGGLTPSYLAASTSSIPWASTSARPD